jgi:hypothetical protein
MSSDSPGRQWPRHLPGAVARQQQVAQTDSLLMAPQVASPDQLQQSKREIKTGSATDQTGCVASTAAKLGQKRAFGAFRQAKARNSLTGDGLHAGREGKKAEASAPKRQNVAFTSRSSDKRVDPASSDVDIASLQAQQPYRYKVKSFSRHIGRWSSMRKGEHRWDCGVESCSRWFLGDKEDSKDLREHYMKKHPRSYEMMHEVSCVARYTCLPFAISSREMTLAPTHACDRLGRCKLLMRDACG